MWTKERIEKLTPAEVKSLRQNALDRGNQEVATLCDQVIAEKPKKVVTRTVKPKAPKKKAAAAPPADAESDGEAEAPPPVDPDSE